MSTITSCELTATLKEILRRSDDDVTREDLIRGVQIECGVGRSRVEHRLGKLHQAGELYYAPIDDGDAKEVRMP